MDLGLEELRRRGANFDAISTRESSDTKSQAMAGHFGTSVPWLLAYDPSIFDISDLCSGLGNIVEFKAEGVSD